MTAETAVVRGDRPHGKLTTWLASQASPLAFSVFAGAMSFITYFCMYGFRKPFAAARYVDYEFHFINITVTMKSHVGFFGQSITLKSALVLSQLVGYALSKFMGIKVNSEMPAARRAVWLIATILWAEAALVLFAVMPPEGKLVAIFLNGLPLGMVWGLVFSFLEGRRVSEILGAVLSCSYIVASGMVKSVGAWFLSNGITESWMPAVTGLLFLPLFFVSTYFMSQLPPPSEDDVRARTARTPMDKHARRAFLRRYLPGIVMLIIVYIFLTGYRDIRDNFAADLWKQLGYGGEPAVFTQSELPIALAVMTALALLYLVKSNWFGLLGCYGIMIAGSILIGVSTLLFDAGAITGMGWMILVGLGLYLSYVPYGCVLFDRTIAALGSVGTAVFLIYLSDAFAYSGAVAATSYKELGQPSASWLEFFRYFSYVVSAVTTAFFVASCLYFMRRTSRSAPD